MVIKKLLFVVLMLLPLAFYAQQSLEEKLASHGFENIRVFSKDNELYIGYENNRYRFEGDAFYKVTQIIADHSTGLNTHVLIYNTGLPVVYFNFPSKVLNDIKAGRGGPELIDDIYSSLNIDALERLYNDHTAYNSSFFKFDFQLGFHLDYQLGNFDNGVKEKLYARPNLQTVLGHGTQLNLSHQMVIINDYNNQNYSRPYMAVLSQDYRLPYNGFINAAIGYFEFNRFGYNIRFNKLLFEEVFYAELNYGMSRYSYLDENISPIYRSNQQTFYNGALNYRWRKHDIDFNFTYGTYMQNDLGYRLSISRQFEDKFIHLFYKKTNLGDVGGFGFIATLPQKKFSKPRRLRARLGDDFRLNYNYFGNTIARSYSTGPSLFGDIKEYYPSILLKALDKRLQKSSSNVD